MNSVSVRAPTAPQLDDDTFVPEDLICYHKAHLRRIGLALAATCDRTALIGQWGTVLGEAIYAQSRDPSEPHRPRSSHRPKITLAKSAPGFVDVPIDFDDATADAA
jgi:hypothetical protein